MHSHLKGRPWLYRNRVLVAIPLGLISTHHPLIYPYTNTGMENLDWRCYSGITTGQKVRDLNSQLLLSWKGIKETLFKMQSGCLNGELSCTTSGPQLQTPTGRSPLDYPPQPEEGRISPCPATSSANEKAWTLNSLQWAYVQRNPSQLPPLLYNLIFFSFDLDLRMVCQSFAWLKVRFLSRSWINPFCW